MHLECVQRPAFLTPPVSVSCRRGQITTQGLRLAECDDPADFGMPEARKKERTIQT
jgi:hypothetical protein